jgi:hypothetical protein
VVAESFWREVGLILLLEFENVGEEEKPLIRSGVVWAVSDELIVVDKLGLAYWSIMLEFE